MLAYLALTPGAQAPRASLATRFWGEGGEDDARNNLRQVLFRIRRSLGTASGALALEGDTVGLDTALIETDALTFQRLASRGEEASLAEAAALYRGELLEGLDVGEPSFDEWLRGERERLRQLGIDVLSRFLAKDLERGRREAAIQTALRLLAMDPLREDVHQTLIVHTPTRGAGQRRCASTRSAWTPYSGSSRSSPSRGREHCISTSSASPGHAPRLRPRRLGPRRPGASAALR